MHPPIHPPIPSSPLTPSHPHLFPPPARPEAAAAITRCTEAGVRIMMITGDSKGKEVSMLTDT